MQYNGGNGPRDDRNRQYARLPRQPQTSPVRPPENRPVRKKRRRIVVKPRFFVFLAVCVLLCNHAVKQETVTQCAEYGYIFQPGMGYYALLAFGWGVLISSAFMLLLPYQRPFFLSARRAEEDWER